MVGKMSRPRKLALTWFLLSFLFVSSAVVLVIVSTIWNEQGASTRAGVPDRHTLRTITISQENLSSAIVLSVVILVSFLMGCVGFYLGMGPDKGNNTMGLVVFNWSLIATTVVTVVVGSTIWFYTLTERNDYMVVWLAQPPVIQSFLQDTLSCCGYWNATTTGLLTQTNGFCSSIANASAVMGCVTPITAFADFFLNNTFTTIYGFTAVHISLFLTTCCLIISRREEARFRLIDTKTGGGFV